ncbi:hypothetical protein [Corynebacterium cystitidis]|uniref:hypothetical protein n=1 Tax=Corynebacterium cystitidis TaxID=35757 RepID=UPI00211E478E|nr:hypothetical protein [Corynebacterium cystitidis]
MVVSFHVGGLRAGRWLRSKIAKTGFSGDAPKEEKCFQGLAFLNYLDEHLDLDSAEEELIDASILFDDYSG